MASGSEGSDNTLLYSGSGAGGGSVQCWSLGVIGSRITDAAVDSSNTHQELDLKDNVMVNVSSKVIFQYFDNIHILMLYTLYHQVMWSSEVLTKIVVQPTASNSQYTCQHCDEEATWYNVLCKSYFQYFKDYM